MSASDDAPRLADISDQARPLNEAEVGALARRVVAEHMWRQMADGCIEWEDFPLLDDGDFHALETAINAYVRDLHTVSLNYDKATGIDSQWLLGRARG